MQSNQELIKMTTVPMQEFDNRVLILAREEKEMSCLVLFLLLLLCSCVANASKETRFGQFIRARISTLFAPSFFVPFSVLFSCLFHHIKNDDSCCFCFCFCCLHISRLCAWSSHLYKYIFIPHRKTCTWKMSPEDV